MPFKTTVSQAQNVVTDLTKLQGLTIPNPELNQGAIVNVKDDGSGQGAYYGLFVDLVNAPPPDGVNVLNTILGGNSRWMRMNLATTEIPPQTLVFHAAGRILNDGTAEAGFNYTSEQTGTGEYRVTVGALPPNVVADQLIFTATVRRGDLADNITVAQDIVPNERRFLIDVFNSTAVDVQDAPFDFLCVIGPLIPIP